MPIHPLSKSQSIASWICQMAAALILFQTLYFKFSGAPESVYIFEAIGVAAVSAVVVVWRVDLRGMHGKIGDMRLDKSIFKKQSFGEAADHQAGYREMDDATQAETFRYLMSVAYGFVGRECPRMDKTVFHKRRHEETTR